MVDDCREDRKHKWWMKDDKKPKWMNAKMTKAHMVDECEDDKKHQWWMNLMRIKSPHGG